MTEMLLRFFEFDKWANHETMHSLEQMTNPPDRAVALIAHIAATQRLWFERVLSVPQSVAVWPQWSLPETAKQLPAVLGDWTRLIATTDLSREFVYTNTKGEQFRNRVGDVALHVAFHGVYHRGQIAALGRQHGGEPAYTDFIQAVRTEAQFGRSFVDRIKRLQEVCNATSLSSRTPTAASASSFLSRGRSAS